MLSDSGTLQQFLHLAFVGLCISSTMMLAIWIVARKIMNAGIVDVAWSAGFTLVTIYYCACGAGDLTQRWLICIMTAIWSMRLSLHLLNRVLKHHPIEDGRYAALRKEWGESAQRNLLIFFQIQALSISLLSVPMIACCQKQSSSLSFTDFAGILIWLTGVVGESIADKQLKQFSSDPQNKGKTCTLGLWNYSRHPNYFFEWIIWIGFFLFSLSSPLGIYTAFVPILMLHFLINVTGVKLTEEQASRSRADYKHYQQTTSAFVPWFKKGKS